MDNPIVITGFGMVSALGCDAAQAFARMERGDTPTGTRELNGAQVPAAAVDGFDAGRFINPKKVRRMDAVNTYAIAAASMALTDAGVDAAHKTNVGVIVGTGYSGFASVVEHQRAYLRDGLRQLTPIHFPNTVYNATAGMVAIELGLNGPNSTVVGLDVCGEMALTYAWMLLQHGMSERIVVIGADDLCPALLEGLHDLGFPRRETTAGAPFARVPHGYLPSEGAGALVLETAAAAAARGARVLGRIDGIGIHASADSALGYGGADSAVQNAVTNALNRAGIDLAAIDWVSSAANGSTGIDRAEASAWSTLLNQSRHRLVTFKRFVGEFAASGVLRLGLGLQCLAHGRVPRCTDDDTLGSVARLLPGANEAHRGRRFLHQGLGVGGNAVSVIVSA